uniref:Transmembrane protein n=1 Tax=Rhizophora mucronata TaxID=61149 RepID=A0A2P2JQZ7_RHIMU
MSIQNQIKVLSQLLIMVCCQRIYALILTTCYIVFLVFSLNKSLIHAYSRASNLQGYIFRHQLNSKTIGFCSLGPVKILPKYIYLNKENFPNVLYFSLRFLFGIHWERN